MHIAQRRARKKNASEVGERVRALAVLQAKGGKCIKEGQLCVFPQPYSPAQLQVQGGERHRLWSGQSSMLK